MPKKKNKCGDGKVHDIHVMLEGRRKSHHMLFAVSHLLSVVHESVVVAEKFTASALLGPTVQLILTF